MKTEIISTLGFNEEEAGLFESYINQIEKLESLKTFEKDFEQEIARPIMDNKDLKQIEMLYVLCPANYLRFCILDLYYSLCFKADINYDIQYSVEEVQTTLNVSKEQAECLISLQEKSDNINEEINKLNDEFFHKFFDKLKSLNTKQINYVLSVTSTCYGFYASCFNFLRD